MDQIHTSPVVAGFTAGIAVIIFSSQVKDLLGLSIAKVPAGFTEQWAAIWAARNTLNISTVTVAGVALAVIIGLRRYAPKLPGFLIVVVCASISVYFMNLPLETIGSKFGGIPSTLPIPTMPVVTPTKLGELLPSAFTIAFLAGVESLLSAVVADGMTGRRHRSNCELVAQGVANVASAFFGGMPATGAIARTATNIKSGARSPVSGMLHAVFVLLFMLLLAPLAGFVPLASLGAVLVVVAWNMSEAHKFRHLLRAPLGDSAVLLLTFGLTVLVDLTVAIEVGIVLAAILFMHRMAEVVSVQQGVELIEEDRDDFERPRTEYTQRAALPEGVEVFQLRGPLFFGSAGRLADVLDNIGKFPRVFILRMSDVPMIDSTGVAALSDFIGRCKGRGTAVIASGVGASLRTVLTSMGFDDEQRSLRFADNFEAALILAQDVA